jgi:hypothetical protein
MEASGDWNSLAADLELVTQNVNEEDRGALRRIAFDYGDHRKHCNPQPFNREEEVALYLHQAYPYLNEVILIGSDSTFKNGGMIVGIAFVGGAETFHSSI